MSRYIWWIIAVALILGYLFQSSLTSFWVNLLWFSELNYRSVYLSILRTQVLLGLGFALAFFFIVYANLWVARRWAPPIPRLLDEYGFRERMGLLARRSLDLLLLAGCIIGALFAGLEASSRWEQFLLFLYAQPFGKTDPIFHKDIGFYVFHLPIWRYLYYWLLIVLLLALTASALVHYFDKALQVVMGIPRFAPHVKVHLSVLSALLLGVIAWGYWLRTYGLLQSSAGVVFGAGYADIHARLPMLKILAGLSLLCSLLFLINLRLRGFLLPLVGLGGLVFVSLVGGTLYPAGVQKLRVAPNEIFLELPYIAYNIRYTREAFGLDRSRVVPYRTDRPLTRRELDQNVEVLDNIRLWDHALLLKSYRQQQELRPYYSFLDVDVDRYNLKGRYQQVMLSARELDITALRNPTWQAQRMQYTHGYGLVMSPTNGATEDGGPIFLISDIPPQYPENLPVKRPEIYYGEADNGYCLVRTRQLEFDYPKGATNAYTRYSGTGGISIGSFPLRLLFALYLGDPNFLLSRDITSESRVMIRRTVMERLWLVAPFLLWDPDPYLVLADGRLYWIVDGYTYTDQYPYSRRFFDRRWQYNYIRNSVKAVVDAYNGSVFFYVVDPQDPLLRAYRSAFPRLFLPLEKMPPSLRSHLRYPEHLFKVQSEVYREYHMTDPRVFYLKEDAWDIATETGSTGEEAPMEPYYVVTRLPGEEQVEFILIRPYTPRGKRNMVAWMAARCDPQVYGQIIVFEFPKSTLTDGPALVENRINTDPAISRERTLWGQQGSSVLFGNLLVIPVAQSVIFVQPLYLEGAAKIPQLKRVIIALETPKRVAMGSTLQETLEFLFGRGTPPGKAPPSPPLPSIAGVPSEVRQLIQQANQHWQSAKSALQRGDFANYGREMAEVERLLNELQQRVGQ